MIACVYPNVNPTLQAAKHVPAELSNLLHLFNSQLTWDCPKKHRWMDYDRLILSYGTNLKKINGLLVSMMAKPFASLGLFIWSHLIHSHSFWYSNPPGDLPPGTWSCQSLDGFRRKSELKATVAPICSWMECWWQLVGGFHYPVCYIVLFLDIFGLSSQVKGESKDMWKITNQISWRSIESIVHPL